MRIASWKDARSDRLIFVEAEVFWHPFGMHSIAANFPGVYAALRPPATFCHPFGMNRKSHMETVRFLSSLKIPDQQDYLDRSNEPHGCRTISLSMVRSNFPG